MRYGTSRQDKQLRVQGLKVGAFKFRRAMSADPVVRSADALLAALESAQELLLFLLDGGEARRTPTERALEQISAALALAHGDDNPRVTENEVPVDPPGGLDPSTPDGWE